MAFRLKDEQVSKGSPEVAFALLALLSVGLAADVAIWARTGCIRLYIDGPLVCGNPGTAIASMYSAAVLVFWIAIYGRVRLRWFVYDPTWLVELAARELPSETWLAGALSTCRRGGTLNWRKRKVYFVNPSRPNEPGSEWHFKESIVFESYEKGPVVLEILQNGQVGSVECTWVVGFFMRPSAG